jgi:hypothetical protein
MSKLPRILTDSKYQFALVGVLVLLLIAYFPPGILNEVQRAAIGDSLLEWIGWIVTAAVGAEGLRDFALFKDAKPPAEKTAIVDTALTKGTTNAPKNPDDRY